MFLFSKIIKKGFTIISLSYVIPKLGVHILLVTLNIFLQLKLITAFKIIFFPSTVIEWNHSIRILRSRSNSVFNVLKSLGLTYLTRLRVGLSHLREHNFCQHFLNSLSPISYCGSGIGSTKHYHLLCSNFPNEKQSLLLNNRITNPNLLSPNKIDHLLLYIATIIQRITNAFL